MKFIEKQITPLIAAQFPEIYREEGQLFILFIKAYYEWLENHLQELVFDDDENFLIDDIVTQGPASGKIISKFGNRYIISITSDEEFKCNRLCNDLTIANSSSGGSSLIRAQRKFNVEYIARRLPEYRDIDKTIDQFIVQFKNKYLPDIQFTTASNKQLFIKNSLDFYRAKGTERAVDLFFKLIYGFEAKVYYPGDDIFKPSDNEWIDVQYIEIDESENNVQFVGQTVVGAKSGATAFVERYVRIRKNSRYISVLYLANVSGNFQTDETIMTINLTTNVVARMLGSLSSFEITSSQPNFIVGEEVFVEDGEGKGARARVTNVVDRVGVVEFNLLQGGWGYGDNTQVLGSERMLRLDNLVLENSDYYGFNDTLKTFETVKQDLITVEANTVFPINTPVIAESNSIQIFTGTVVSSNTDLSTMVINYDSTTVDSNTLITTELLYSVDETLSTDILSINTNSSATANVIASGINASIVYNGSPQLQRGDIIVQKDSNDDVFFRAEVLESSANIILEESYLDIQRVEGMFRTNLPFFNAQNNNQYNIIRSGNNFIGIINIVNTFYNGANTYGVESGTHARSLSFTYEIPASFDIVSRNNIVGLDNYKTDTLIDELDLSDIIETANVAFNDPIANTYTFDYYEIGSVQSIVVRNPGRGYATDPFYIIFDPTAYHLERYDFTLNYIESQKNFSVGEIVSGQTSGCRGVITQHDRVNRVMKVTRIHIANDLSVSEDFIIGELIQGESTGISATLSNAYENRRENRTGLNAVVESRALNGVGFVAELRIIDSGFGYFDNELLTLVSTDRNRKTIGVIANLGKQGIGQGYHTSTKSYLSSNKYIQDSDYYQEYSYEVLTALPFEVYKQTLIDVLHVAGTKPFGSYSSSAETQLTIDADSTIESIED